MNDDLNNKSKIKLEHSISVVTEEATTKNMRLNNQLLKRFNDWSLVTTIHAVPNIVRAWSACIIWRLVYWVVSLIICLVLCTILVKSNIDDYLQLDVVTKIRSLPQDGGEYFPVVSICNENPFISPQGNEYLKEYFKKKYNITVSKFDDVMAYLGVNMTIYEMIQIPYWMNSPNQSKSFGYSNEELFLDINYFGLDIDPSELERFFDPYYGPCVRFNSGKNSRGESIPRLPLVVSGLGITMEIFMGLSDDIREYIYEPERRGLRIEVKDVDGYPFISNSVVVGSGLYSIMKISKTHSNMLEKPYSECSDVSRGSFGPKTNELIAGLKQLNITYSQQYCTELLIQNHCIEDMNCYDLRLLNYKGDKVKPCDNITQVNDRDSNWINNEACPLECDSTKYSLAISQDEYPTLMMYQLYLQEKPSYFERLFNKTVNEITFDMFKKSFTRLTVYYEDLSVMELSETVQIDRVKLVSNLGGTIGLFLGVSLISAVECLELIIVLILIIIKYYFYKFRS